LGEQGLEEQDPEDLEEKDLDEQDPEDPEEQRIQRSRIYPVRSMSERCASLLRCCGRAAVWIGAVRSVLPGRSVRGGLEQAGHNNSNLAVAPNYLARLRHGLWKAGLAA